MNLRTRLLGFVALVALLPLAANAATTLTLPAGTDVNATIDGTLDSQSAHVGDVFTAHVVAPYPRDNTDLSGAVITGHVDKVVHAGQGTKPEFHLLFDTIRLSDGSTAPIDGQVTAMQTKGKMKSGARVAAYTVGGLILGNVLAKTVLGSGARGGGLLGAAGGFILGNNYKNDVQVPAGSTMTVTLRHTMAIRRQAHRY
ncbi:MAG: hypothetical protein DLM50_08520 [Candidatus Meridianibacter frigidus]|nr:MAG: hypothetical protein DLM50_08520 [Candidatus Eremiobacteraeota bacterium]